MILPEGGQNKERYWGDSAYLTGQGPRLMRRDILELRWMRLFDERFPSSRLVVTGFSGPQAQREARRRDTLLSTCAKQRTPRETTHGPQMPRSHTRAL
jgi:hypothetical protein